MSNKKQYRWAVVAAISLLAVACGQSPETAAPPAQVTAADPTRCDKAYLDTLDPAERRRIADACFARGNLDRPNTGKKWGF